MSETVTAERTYRVVPWALIPGVALRGGVVGLVCAPVAALFVLFVLASAEGTWLDTQLQELLNTVGFGPIVALGFVLPVAGSLALAFASHRRRQFEFGENGITATGGLFSTRETFVAFEDVEGATFTQSKVQSIYGAGTIRIETGEGTRKLGSVEDPEAVYTEVLRQVADVTGSTSGGPDTSDFETLSLRSGDISRLSAERAAADTGFRYLMPTAIVHPEPRAAAAVGLLFAFLYSLVGFFLLAVLSLFLLPLLGLSGWQYLGIMILGYVVYSGILAAWFYWRYDRMQYEFYRDHLRIVKRGETTSISFEELASVKVPARDASVRVDRIQLHVEDGSRLETLDFVEDPAAVGEYLQALVDGA